MRGHDTAKQAAPRSSARSGFAAAVAAFLICGLFPLYLKPLSGVPAMQILAHRIVWCCLLVFAWLALRGELSAVRRALADPGTRLRLVAWRTPRGVYWVSNTLSKTLTNRQMLAIARSLTRVGS
jgi:EamA domain-containing membrane protein RarD